MTWDVFISYASEDKSFVEPLARELNNRGLKVWFDKFELKLGDRLLERISVGLQESRFGLVILSPLFFEKRWPQMELAAIVQSEQSRDKMMLPIWHGVDEQMIRKYSPVLADRVAIKSCDGLELIVEAIVHVVGQPREVSVLRKVPGLDHVSADALSSVVRRWSFRDAKLSHESNLSADRIAILKALTTVHLDDVPIEASRELLEDRSIPATDALLASALDWADSTAAYELANIGVPGLPWLIALFLLGSDDALVSVVESITDAGFQQRADAKSREFRYIAALKELKIWDQIASRLTSCGDRQDSIKNFLEFAEFIDVASLGPERESS